MTRTALVVAVALAGCATAAAGRAPVQVRAPDGSRLPTTARLDAEGSLVQVHCGTAAYVIVPAPPPFVHGRRIGTAQVVVRDAAALCARIAAAD